MPSWYLAKVLSSRVASPPSILARPSSKCNHAGTDRFYDVEIRETRGGGEREDRYPKTRKPNKARDYRACMPPAPRSRIVIRNFTPPPEGKGVLVVAEGQPVAVFNLSGTLFAVGAQCSHQGGPLVDGELSEHRIECPWHGSVFDIETGKVLRGPAETPVAAYRAYMDKEGLILEPRPFDSGVPAGH